jgi:TonB family protein
MLSSKSKIFFMLGRLSVVLIFAAMAFNAGAQTPSDPSSTPPAHKSGSRVTPPAVILDPSPPPVGSRGVVVLSLVVDPKGVPRDLKVVKSLDRNSDEAALKTVKEWRFQPAKKDGQPVAVKVNVEVNFR